MIGLLAVLISGTVFQASAQEASPSPTAAARSRATEALRRIREAQQTPSPGPTKPARKSYMDAHRKVASQTPAPASHFPQLKVLPETRLYMINLEAKDMVPNHTYAIGIWGGKRIEPFTLQDYRPHDWTLTTDSAGHGVVSVEVYCICHPGEYCLPEDASFGQPKTINIGLYEPGKDFDQLGVGPLVQTTSPTCR